MPSSKPLPSIRQLLRAFYGEIAARREDADTHDGAMYDHLAGVGAILWRRVAERDLEEFRSVYFGMARNNRLDTLIERRFSRSRVQLTRGQGTMVVIRASTAAGGGTFWRGTRIAIGDGSASPLRFYLVASDTYVQGTDTYAEIPVEAAKRGPDGAVSVGAGDVRILRVEDPLWDITWEVDSVEVAPGTAREKDHEYRSNALQERLDARVGYTKRITDAMQAAGAAQVVLFRSDYFGAAYDYGLNRVYVGDQSGETTEALLKACRLAMPTVGMAGANLQALPMSNTVLTVDLELTVDRTPTNAARLASYAKAAIVEYFATRENPFVWRADAVTAAAMRAVQGTLDSTLTTSAPEPTLTDLFNTPPLTRYRVESYSVNVTVAGSD